VHVACTSTVWHAIERAAAAECKDKPGEGHDYEALATYVYDLCFMAVHAKVKIYSPAEHLFEISLPIGAPATTLKLNCGPGDNGEPVINNHDARGRLKPMLTRRRGIPAGGKGERANEMQREIGNAKKGKWHQCNKRAVIRSSRKIGESYYDLYYCKEHKHFAERTDTPLIHV